MITEDQREVIEFLSSPSTHGAARVDRVETHASIVFLAGPRAWKLKRAVRYDYLDFSDKERRRALCEAEVRINRRTAPTLYHRVVAVTRSAGDGLELGGDGVPVDWVIEMTRFDQEDLFDRRAARGELDLGLMRPLASAIARFHSGAERRPDHGGTAGIAWVIDGNEADLRAQGAGILDAADVDAVTSGSRAALQSDGALLERRRTEGQVRQCHGDLHLRNIVLFEGAPTLFDGIEFNDRIACIDVLYDLAFLLMDLWRRRLPRHANVVWNGYLADTGDLAGIPLLPLFLSCRAAVRAKTSLAAAALQTGEDPRIALEAQAREYLGMALQFLRPPAPSVVAIGGVSGTGKSSLAYAVAPSIGAVPGAVVLRSDEIRKELLGVPPVSRLGPEGYAPDVSRRVYEALGERAAAAGQAGHGVIADAVFGHAVDRMAIEQTAARASLPFVGLWLEAPEQVLVERVQRRRADASDADAAVIRMQLEEDTGPVTWRRLDAAPGADDVLRQARTHLEDAMGERLMRLDKE